VRALAAAAAELQLQAHCCCCRGLLAQAPPLTWQHHRAAQSRARSPHCQQGCL
jgi:hypothetical protein